MATAKSTKAAKAADTETKVEDPTFSAKDIANELNIDAKAFRRWLRAHTEDRANKGGRWIFTPDAKAQLLAEYNKKAEGTDAKLKS